MSSATLTDSELDADPVFRLLLSGRARTAQEAERIYLDDALPEVLTLLRVPAVGRRTGPAPTGGHVPHPRESRLGGLAAVTPDERLAAVVSVLESAGLTCLVMGGHAVRFYGLHRYTSDFDLHLSADGWDDLAERLNRSPLAAAGPLPEGPSWRPHAFRRFQIGRLDDGREEWLEFWRGEPPARGLLVPARPSGRGRVRRGGYCRFWASPT